MADVVEVEFTPNAGQRRFLSSTARFKLACTGIGGGKSAVGAIEALWLALKNPGRPGMIVSPTYDLLRLNTVPPILQFWPMEFIENPSVLHTRAGSFDLQLRNGTPIYFRSADNPDHLRGPNLAWGWLDECGQMAEYAWNIMEGRVRVPCPVPRIIGTTTPKGLNWLYDKFVANVPSDRYEMIRWDATLNAVNMREGFYEELAESYSPLLARQELLGEFVNINAEALLSYESVIECERDRYPLYPKMDRFGKRTPPPLYMGVDVGRRHDVTAITKLYRIGDTYHTALMKRLKDVPFGEQMKELSVQMRDVTQCCVDSTGIGMQLAEEMQKSFGQAVEPVVFTRNSKTDLAARLRKLFDKRQLRIPRDPLLRASLLSVEKQVNEKGQITLNASRNVDGHADEFWSYALACRAAGTFSDVVLDFVGHDPDDRDDEDDGWLSTSGGFTTQVDGPFI